MPSYAAYIPASELESRSIAAEFYSPHFLESARTLHRAPGKVTTLGKLVVAPINNSIRNVTHVLGVDGATVPMFRPADMDGWWVSELTAPKLPEDFEADHVKSRVHAGDIVLAIAGTIAKVGRVSPGVQRGAINGSCARIRLLGSVATYGLAFLNSRYGRAGLERLAVGSVQKHLNLVDLPSVPFLVPDRRIQDYIGAKVELAERCRARALLERQRVAAAFEELLAESQFGAREGLSRWVPGDEMLTRWLNAGYYRQVFSDLQAHLRSRSVRTVPLASVAQCNRGKSRPEVVVRYIEISDIDTEEGAISGGRDCTPEETPKNAQRIVRTGDVLMSTRRPDRGAVACATERDDGAFCSVFLARIQCDQEKVLPRFLQEYLRRPSGKLFIAQRCTETTYPVISEDDIETIPIPLVPRQVQARISAASRRAEVLRGLGVALVGDAKADVEALIEGTLDVQAILAGTLKAPTADDIPELAEDAG